MVLAAVNQIHINFLMHILLNAFLNRLIFVIVRLHLRRNYIVARLQDGRHRGLLIGRSCHLARSVVVVINLNWLVALPHRPALINPGQVIDLLLLLHQIIGSVSLLMAAVIHAIVISHSARGHLISLKEVVLIRNGHVLGNHVPVVLVDRVVLVNFAF